MLPPLTFYEFITMQGLGHYLQPIEHIYGGKNVQLFKAADIRQFNKSFVDYLNFGGYPEALFSPSVRENPERFIRNDVIDKVLLRDLPALYGISNVQELNSLFTTIAYNTANEFSIETLSIQAACSKSTLKKYLEYLEAAFLIKTVRRVDQSGHRFQRDNFFKMYLTNPSLRAALFSPVQPEEETVGQLTETAVYAQWMHRISFIPWYARWTQGTQGEVDLVGISKKDLQPLWAVDIKWTDRYVTNPGELKSLLKFCAENGLRQAVGDDQDRPRGNGIQRHNAELHTGGHLCVRHRRPHPESERRPGTGLLPGSLKTLTLRLCIYPETTTDYDTFQ